jgi:pimeloyl-ACP methyl ester carboxylesterase
MKWRNLIGMILTVAIVLSLAISGAGIAYGAESSEPEDRYFTTSDGVTLHYRVCGTGEPLVILPGFGATADSFDANYEALQENFTVYTLEYRGCGQSEVPTYGYHIERMAADFKELLDAEELENVNVLGHSMGNSVFWCYVEIWGQDRIDKYVLAEEGPTFVSDPSWTEEEQTTYRGTMDWDMFMTPAMQATMSVPQEGESEETGLARGEGMARLWKDHLANDWSDVIPEIKVPTLLIFGANSHFASENLWNFMQDSIEGSELLILENTGHLVNQESPEEFNAAVIDFLTE